MSSLLETPAQTHMCFFNTHRFQLCFILQQYWEILRVYWKRRIIRWDQQVGSRTGLSNPRSRWLVTSSEANYRTTVLSTYISHTKFGRTHCLILTHFQTCHTLRSLIRSSRLPYKSSMLRFKPGFLGQKADVLTT